MAAKGFMHFAGIHFDVQAGGRSYGAPMEAHPGGEANRVAAQGLAREWYGAIRDMRARPGLNTSRGFYGNIASPWMYIRPHRLPVTTDFSGSLLQGMG